MSEAKVYHQDNLAHITNARAVLIGTTYAMSNITSVSIGKIPVKWDRRVGGVVMVLFGLNITFAGSPQVFATGPISVGIMVLIFGIALIAGGVAVFKSAKETYIVRLSTSGGQVDGLVSPDRQYVQKVHDAISNAIVGRG